MSPLALFKAAALLTIGTGLVSALGAHPATAGAWGLVFDAVRWPVDGAQGTFSDEARLMSAIHGGVLAGWGAMLFMLAQGPLARGEAEARRMTWTGLLVWYAIDSIGSVAAGWPANVAVNTAFLAMFALPLLAMGRAKAALAA